MISAKAENGVIRNHSIMKELSSARMGGRESMAEQKAGGFGNRYTFNGKEQDALSGLYYYGARFYDPVVSVWISVDPLADEPEQVDKSPYIAFWNNPIKYDDPDGTCPRCAKALIKTFVKSVRKGKFDLGEVYDIVDNVKTLVSPGSTLMQRGEAVFNLASPVSTKDLKAISKVADGASDVKKKAKKVEEQTGSYTNHHEKGRYHGKGGKERAAESAKEKEDKYDDPLIRTDWTPAKNDREAFKQESRRLDTDRVGKTKGHKNPNNYNKRDSPGTNFRKQDGEIID